MSDMDVVVKQKIYELRAVALRKLAMKNGFNIPIDDIYQSIKKHEDEMPKMEAYALELLDRKIYKDITTPEVPVQEVLSQSTPTKNTDPKFSILKFITKTIFNLTILLHSCPVK